MLIPPNSSSRCNPGPCFYSFSIRTGHPVHKRLEYFGPKRQGNRIQGNFNLCKVREKPREERSHTFHVRLLSKPLAEPNPSSWGRPQAAGLGTKITELTFEVLPKGQRLLFESNQVNCPQQQTNKYQHHQQQNTRIRRLVQNPEPPPHNIPNS